MAGKQDAKKPAPGRGQLPLKLPHTLQLLILARIPIYELRRLLIQEINPEFSAAIRRVLGEIALEVLRLTLKGNKHWGSKDADHVRQESKARYLYGDGEGPWRVENSYPDLYCCWRDRPLSAALPERSTGWIYGDVESSTWIEGGRRFQPSLEPKGSLWGSGRPWSPLGTRGPNPRISSSLSVGR
jgi:hypothetical protein